MQRRHAGSATRRSDCWRTGRRRGRRDPAALADDALAVSDDGSAGHLIEQISGATHDSAPVGKPSRALNSCRQRPVRNVIGAALRSFGCSTNRGNVSMPPVNCGSVPTRRAAAYCRRRSIGTRRRSPAGLVASSALIQIRLARSARSDSPRCESFAAVPADVLATLERLTATRADGGFVEPIERVAPGADRPRRRGTAGWRSRVPGRVSPALARRRPDAGGDGLAITYGLLGVINMAHGEMIDDRRLRHLRGAGAGRQRRRGLSTGIRCIALPVRLHRLPLVGILIERSGDPLLYERPLETLLATWGVSLILIQTMRQIFGRAERGYRTRLDVR